MNRIRFLFLFAGGLLFLGGCAPTVAPMPQRLPEQQQKQVDDSWDRMLTPVNRVNHQEMLDVLVGTGAFHNGVDKLYFRSEKKFAGGLVVMEAHFERALPAEDRFEVKILASDGTVLRKEAYSREEVDRTMHDLFPAPPAPKEGQEPPEAARQREKAEVRWNRIREVFPPPKEEAKREEIKGPRGEPKK